MSLVDRALGAVGLQLRSSAKSAHPGDPALVAWLGGLSDTASGINVTPENARDCPEVDACVGLIEDTVATVPLDLFKRTGEGTRERVAEHPLHQLLHDKPNAWQTSAEFRQMMEGWRQTHGNAYARVVSGPRGPQALEPVHPDEMDPFRFRGGVAYHWRPSDGAEQTLLQHEVLHLRDGPPKRGNIVKAQSKVTRHRESIGLVMASSQYLARFFGTGGTPKLKLKIPGSVGEASVDQLREAFERRHHGPENARRVAVLTHGLDLEALGLSNTDNQVIESHELGVAKVARIFGVPLHLIGETSKATSWGTGIEQQSIGFITYYMRPKFVVWEQALNATLMSDEMRQSYYFEFNIDGLLRGDFKTRMEGYALLIQWGLSTPNEIRRLMNLPPVDGGDERLHPLNMAPASRIMDVLLREGSGKSQRDAFDQATRMLAAVIESGAIAPKVSEAA